MVCILLGTGFEEAEALVPADMLRRANIDVCMAGVDGIDITGAHHITVKADCAVADVNVDELELLFLPGGLGGVDAIKSSPAAMELIRQAHEKGVKLAAICAAPTILAELGYLNGKKAVCYTGFETQLDGAFVTDSSVETDGIFITARGAGVAVEFGLKLVELVASKSESLRQKNAILCD